LYINYSFHVGVEKLHFCKLFYKPRLPKTKASPHDSFPSRLNKASQQLHLIPIENRHDFLSILFL
jgi:hypothetical protein